MLTDHETRPDHDGPRGGETSHALADSHDAQQEFPALHEPSWLDEDLDEEVEEPRDSAFRGIWIGVAAAAVTFVLVFAIPHWLGWYDVGTPGQQAKPEPTPESVISTVTAKSSGVSPAGDATSAPGAHTAGPMAAVPQATTPAATTPPAAPPQVTLSKTPARPAARVPAPVLASAKSTKPDKPAAPATVSKRTFTVQIAAFKDPKQAGRLAERVKRDGYPADVRRVESSAVPWVVRVGGYSSREQAESARDALARKGFRGFVL